MKIFQVMMLVCLCALISLGTVFSGGIFGSLSYEGGSTNEAGTVQAHETVSMWTYIIAILLIIAVIVLALKLYF